MNKKPSPLICWAVQARGRGSSRRTWIVPFTIRRLRTDALASFMANWEHGPSTRWDYWRRRGYQLVKVEVIAREPRA